MKYLLPFLLFAILQSGFSTDNKLVKLSQDLLDASRYNNSTDEIVKYVSQLTEKDLETGLKTDQEKLAFWINIYNGFIQVSLKKNPKLYEDRGTFFKSPLINIGGRTLTFADIEHGIIRHSQFEYGLGYITNFFPGSFERKMRVKKRDFRIHFALNCGAVDCPPVAIYDDQKLNDQLKNGTTKYLKSQTYAEGNKIRTTTLFKWFKGDFGGGSGMKKIIKEYTGIDTGKKEIVYDEYDWTLSLGNFIDL